MHIPKWGCNPFAEVHHARSCARNGMWTPMWLVSMLHSSTSSSIFPHHAERHSTSGVLRCRRCCCCRNLATKCLRSRSSRRCRFCLCSCSHFGWNISIVPAVRHRSISQCLDEKSMPSTGLIAVQGPSETTLTAFPLTHFLLPFMHP